MKNFSSIMQKLSLFIGVIIILLNIILFGIFGISINGTLGILCGLFLVFLGTIYKKLSARIKFVVMALICFGSIFITFLSYLIVSGAINHTTDFSEEVAIVLGSGIRGEEPAPMLEKRLATAVDYLQKNPKAIVVVTGGQGYGETIPEALAMKRYLIAKGIDETRIIEEDTSRNTYENFINTKKILNGYYGNSNYKIVVVTSNFHMFRALKIAKKLGFEAKSYNAPLDWYLLPGSFLRELISLIKYWYWSLSYENL